VALLGPPGSGTSTPPHRRDLGYLAQDVLAFPHLSVAASLRPVLLFDRASAGRGAERVRRTLELCAIAYRADRRPGQLSGGECQRAALGMTALVVTHDPEEARVWLTGRFTCAVVQADGGGASTGARLPAR
jgi:ABC-type Fe3+/spermidine/putrescine transport system ATPase subunit